MAFSRGISRIRQNAELLTLLLRISSYPSQRIANNLVWSWSVPTMSILVMLVIGLLVGIVAKFLLPGNDPGGIIVTMLIGIAGSFIAGYLGRSIGWYSEGQPVGFIASVVGAILLLLVFRLLFRRKA
ncbi:MAG TPA: GlsB/YeaQ/YmgE family stress response membrane protein [Opitutaceae bacterium]|nr:GlsB/YeaQ/YmgE family stress response membrane protein [Opitutaceae bacterium]